MCIDVDKATAKLRRQLEKATARYQKRLAKIFLVPLDDESKLAGLQMSNALVVWEAFCHCDKTGIIKMSTFKNVAEFMKRARGGWRGKCTLVYDENALDDLLAIEREIDKALDALSRIHAELKA